MKKPIRIFLKYENLTFLINKLNFLYLIIYK